jgi:hypothetical protein
MGVSNGVVQYSAISATIAVLPGLNSVETEVGTDPIAEQVDKASDRGAACSAGEDAGRPSDHTNETADQSTDSHAERTGIGGFLDRQIALSIFRDYRHAVEGEATFGMKFLQRARTLISLRLTRKNDDNELTHFHTSD